MKNIKKTGIILCIALILTACQNMEADNSAQTSVEDEQGTETTINTENNSTENTANTVPNDTNGTDADASSTQSDADTGTVQGNTTQSSEMTKTSPDKYTWYIKNYVGKNVASFGYTSLGGSRMDHYGEGYLKLILVTPDGTYVDIDNEDDMKDYVVTAQNVSPNTEMKYTFLKDENGEEYDNLLEGQNIEEIVLAVKKVGSMDNPNTSLIEINVSPDKYTWYVRDYVGRNLTTCGYLALAGDLRDSYGETTVRFVIIPDDGSYIDVSDPEVLKNYVVTSQNIAPNTEIKLEFLKDENGEDYDNLVNSQNIDEIELFVSKVPATE